MGKDDYRRAATAAEIDSIKKLLFADLDAGALGLSTGLEYDEAHSASFEEVLALAQATGAEGGRYVSHIRSEDRAFWPAIDEIIRIGRDGGLPVQISHLKLAMRSLWGRADSLIARLDRARAEGVEITADVYPYTCGNPPPGPLPEHNYTDPAAALTPSPSLLPGGLLIGRWTGLHLRWEDAGRIARLRQSDPATLIR
jgi:N-acyl-D-amino-acid deacylase